MSAFSIHRKFSRSFTALVISLSVSLGLHSPTSWALSDLELQSVIGRVGNFPFEDYTPTGETVELKGRQVENQQQSEECYLFAFINYLQTANNNHFQHVISPRLSGPYLATVKLLEYIDQALTLEEPPYFLRGGNVSDAIELVSTYGLVPEDVWSPRVAFSQWPFPDIYQQIEKVLKVQKNILAQTENKFGKNSKAYQEALVLARQEVSEVLLQWSGDLPEKFKWSGQTWTPQQFAKVYGLQQVRSVQLLLPPDSYLFMDELDLRKQMRRALSPSSISFSLQEKDWENIEDQIRASIDQGLPVPVALNWSRTGHVMTVVGYELRQGKVFAWKFLNSWGRYTSDGRSFFKASDVRKKADQVWLIQ